jgi:integrase
VPRLTDLALKNLPLPERGHITHWDRPLGVRVSSTGVKTFIVILQSGRRHKIGRYGDITLAQARDAAKTLKAEKTLGRIFPQCVGLAQARTQYLAGLAIRTATRQYYERNLNRLHASKLQDVTPRELNRILDSLGPTSRIQAIRTYSAFFNWCIRRHYLDTSPCARMVAGTSTSRARVLSDDELKCIWQACEGAFGTIVKLLIVTGQRRSEIAALHTDFFDPRDATLSLPMTLTKNSRPHLFPVPKLATTTLTAIQPNSRGLFFPARGKSEKPFNGWSKSKAALDRSSGVTDWTLHDLRRTYRTIHARIGTPPHVAERLINHVSSTSEIEKIYDRFTYMPDMQKAVVNFDTHIKTILGIE